MNSFDKENFDAILRGHGDWFTARLIRLIAKADVHNTERLFLAFPDTVTSVCQKLGRAVPTSNRIERSGAPVE
jgi:hypothetical protein